MVSGVICFLHFFTPLSGQRDSNPKYAEATVEIPKWSKGGTTLGIPPSSCTYVCGIPLNRLVFTSNMSESRPKETTDSQPSTALKVLGNLPRGLHFDTIWCLGACPGRPGVRAGLGTSKTSKKHYFRCPNRVPIWDVF